MTGGHPLGSVAETTKQKVNLRLDPDVIEALRAPGDGWQTQVNSILRREVLGPREIAYGASSKTNKKRPRIRLTNNH